MLFTTLSFGLDNFEAGLMTKIGKAAVRFSPQDFRLNGKKYRFDSWNDVESRLTSFDSPLRSLLVTPGNNEGDYMIAVIKREGLCGVSWSQPEFLGAEENLIESLIKLPSFRAGLTFESEMLILGATLKEEDRALNPCRMTLGQGMWLSVGWKNWYGPWALSILDKRRILNFTPTFQTKELSAGTLSVTLTNHPDDPTLAAIQTRYWVETGLADLEKESLC